MFEGVVTSKRFRYSLFGIGLIIFVAAILSIWKGVIIMNENQIAFIYTTTVQVIGSLFGLTLTGFIFLEAKLNEKMKDDDSYYDQLIELKREYYYSIFALGVACILTVIANLYVVFCFSNLTGYLYRLLLNVSMTFFIFELCSIIFFYIEVLNPDNIINIEKRMKDELEADDGKAGNIKVFLKYYNKLEHLLSDRLEKKYPEYYDKTSFNYNNINYNNFQYGGPSLIKVIKILTKNKDISNDDAERINDIRKYRNIVVHGDELEISLNMQKQLKEVYNSLLKKFEVDK